MANPYQLLIDEANGEAAAIQSRYEAHRQQRKDRFKKIFSAPLTTLDIDPVLERLVFTEKEPGFQDPRHCLVFWARPTQALRELIGQVQQRLLQVVPHMWLMPSDCLHMTTLELAHSRSENEIADLLTQIRPGIEKIVDYPSDHATSLVRPQISFDTSALALSFVPAAATTGANYSYHHLRRDVYELCQSAGVAVDSRYVSPSAHLTIARFVTTRDFLAATPTTPEQPFDAQKLKAFVRCVDDLNLWLQQTAWSEEPLASSATPWIVGAEQGLECRKGSLWYGGGSRVLLGRGMDQSSMKKEA